ncbi:MAG: NAD(P)/FAD-dependent oxidoreductase [Verrucomicrobia bacterium]|nr:NAD(P)/FAD-dependent oxidoreductase [Verrucomicrobiota bacterium]
MKKHYQLAVVGAGSAGREAALVAAKEGLQVLLIEKDTLGGTCLHHGCYPVRALRACAEATQDRQRGSKFGLENVEPPIGFEKWLTVQRRVSARLTQEVNNQLEKAGVTVRFANASFTASNQLRIASTHGEVDHIQADYVVVATGSRPSFDQVRSGSRYVNSDGLLTRTEIPKHLLISGGGYIGCEFASIFRSLGSVVTLVEKEDRLLPKWDASLGEYLEACLRSAGVNIQLGHEMDLPIPGDLLGEPELVLKPGPRITPDLVLVATGRKPNIETLGLENLDIQTSPFVEVNEQLRTKCPTVFAVGDANGLSLLDSAAVVQARIAVGAILGRKERFSARWIPRCIHTDPRIASIGWNEEEAALAGLDVISHSQTFRLVTDDERTVVNPLPTMVKILLQSESRKILGVHVVGTHAAEIVNLSSIAIRAGFTLDQVLQVPLVHPSATEVFQECANGLGRIPVG